MLTKELLAVRRYKGRIYPKYVEPQASENQKLAAEVIQLFQAYLYRKREELQSEIEKLETHRNFKVVRGLAQLLERRCLFEVAALPLEPKELRRLLFQRGYVVSREEKESLLKEVARELGLPVETMTEAFWADREEKQLLKGFSMPSDLSSEPPPSQRLDFVPEELLRQYNLSLTQTLLFDALELTFTVSGNFQEIFRWIKYLGLMYEAMEDFSGIQVKVDGPASIFKETVRYGTSLAKLIPAIVRAEEWQLTAKIRDGNSIYFFALDHSKKGLFPQEKPEERFDSAVEEDFARRIRALMPEWTVKREPTILKAGPHILIPDFGFELRHGQNIVRHYLEIVGFWTPEYLERKLAKLKQTQTKMLIAVDQALRCLAGAASTDLETELGAGKEVFFYEKKIPLEPVVHRLMELAEQQKQQEIEKLRDVKIPLEGDLIPLKALAERYGVGIEALKEVISQRLDESYHLVGDKVVSQKMLEELRKRIEALPAEDEGGSKSYGQVQELLETCGLSLSALRPMGFKVESKSLLEMKVVRVK